jgi:glycine dehydrogenase subunit 2
LTRGPDQGALALLWQLERARVEITGLARVTLQPAAGAHGELAGMLMIRGALEDRGARPRTVLIPDSAHGTNPASAVFAGFDIVEVASTAQGTLDLEALGRHLASGDVAALMITVPNTLGVFGPESSALRQCCTNAALSSTWTAQTSTPLSASPCQA